MADLSGERPLVMDTQHILVRRITTSTRTINTKDLNRQLAAVERGVVHVRCQPVAVLIQDHRLAALLIGHAVARDVLESRRIVHARDRDGGIDRVAGRIVAIGEGELNVAIPLGRHVGVGVLVGDRLDQVAHAHCLRVLGQFHIQQPLAGLEAYGADQGPLINDLVAIEGDIGIICGHAEYVLIRVRVGDLNQQMPALKVGAVAVGYGGNCRSDVNVDRSPAFDKDQGVLHIMDHRRIIHRLHQHLHVGKATAHTAIICQHKLDDPVVGAQIALAVVVGDVLDQRGDRLIGRVRVKGDGQVSCAGSVDGYTGDLVPAVPDIARRVELDLIPLVALVADAQLVSGRGIGDGNRQVAGRVVIVIIHIPHPRGIVHVEGDGSAILGEGRDIGVEVEDLGRIVHLADGHPGQGRIARLAPAISVIEGELDRADTCGWIIRVGVRVGDVLDQRGHGRSVRILSERDAQLAGVAVVGELADL